MIKVIELQEIILPNVLKVYYMAQLFKIFQQDILYDKMM